MAKTRRKRLKQFAILNASAKIAFTPESHDLTQNSTLRDPIRFCKYIFVNIKKTGRKST
jgi:hypothetical protein